MDKILNTEFLIEVLNLKCVNFKVFSGGCLQRLRDAAIKMILRWSNGFYTAGGALVFVLSHNRQQEAYSSA